MRKQKGCSPISSRVYRSSIFRFFAFIFCIFIPFEFFLIYFIERLRIYFGYKTLPKEVLTPAIIPVENIPEIKVAFEAKPVESNKPTKSSTRKADNLEEISGIGKKTAEILVNGGVRTFSQLAKLSVEEINAMLSSAGSRVKANQSWIDQAKELK